MVLRLVVKTNCWRGRAEVLQCFMSHRYLMSTHETLSCHHDRLHARGTHFVYGCCWSAKSQAWNTAAFQNIILIYNITTSTTIDTLTFLLLLQIKRLQSALLTEWTYLLNTDDSGVTLPSWQQWQSFYFIDSPLSVISFYTSIVIW